MQFKIEGSSIGFELELDGIPFLVEMNGGQWFIQRVGGDRHHLAGPRAALDTVIARALATANAELYPAHVLVHPDVLNRTRLRETEEPMHRL